MSAVDNKDAQQFLSGQLKEVDVVGIERELRKLWQTAMSSNNEDKHSSVLRACSLNLILYSEAANAESEGGNILDDISINNPCRALLAISRPSEKSQIEAWVSARCHLGGGSKQICCEQITVLSEGQGPEELASAVLPLLVADLPAFLWWRSANLQADRLKPYVSALDRLIVDSQLSANDKNFLATIQPIIKGNDRQVLLSDLNWRRLHAFRKIIAQIFESSQLQPSDLNKISQLEITYTGENNNGQQEFNCATAQSWLLLGWFAARLGWQKTKGLAFRKDKQDIQVTFTAIADAKLAPGNIFQVDLHLGSSGKVTIGYDWQRQFQSPLPPNLLATTANGGGETIRLTSLSPNLSESYLVGQELRTLSYDPLFEQALQLVAQTFEKN
jgi:glucose-6-phosphate dehydrogenase assembly protein OpcA